MDNMIRSETHEDTNYIHFINLIEFYLKLCEKIKKSTLNNSSSLVISFEMNFVLKLYANGSKLSILFSLSLSPRKLN